MSAARQSLGRRGEQLAAEHLSELGWPILARNWRTRGGELDLVARDDDWLVMVEVRARRGGRFGRPEESIDHRKQRRLLQLGARYVQHVGWRGAWRIDVVAIEFPESGPSSNDAAPTSATHPDSLAWQASPPSPAAATALSPERLLPGGIRLRHIRNAVAP